MTRAGALRLAAPGFTLAAVLAFLAKTMAEALSEGLGGLPPLPISPVLCAVVLGMIWRNVLDVPRWAGEGLSFAMTTVLRVGIALVGLKLTLAGAQRDRGDCASRGRHLYLRCSAAWASSWRKRSGLLLALEFSLRWGLPSADARR